MNDWYEDFAWFFFGAVLLFVAYALASYSDYRTERESECAAQGMRWSQSQDKCVPRKPRVAPEIVT